MISPARALPECTVLENSSTLMEDAADIIFSSPGQAEASPDVLHHFEIGQLRRGLLRLTVNGNRKLIYDQN